MKVTTDGCLFGAVVANEMRSTVPCRLLDIGTGTGLLSLMVAQENTAASFEAVEIDAAAAEQAAENIAASPWAERIQVKKNDILQFEPSFQYDFIISNPPFYEQQLSSPDKGRQLAHHSSELTLIQLFQQGSRLLKKAGRFFVLLPFYRTEEAIAFAKAHGFFAEKQWQVRQTPKHSFFRTIFCFNRRPIEMPARFEITIRDEKGNYTDDFTSLLQPFYLHL